MPVPKSKNRACIKELIRIIHEASAAAADAGIVCDAARLGRLAVNPHQ